MRWSRALSGFRYSAVDRTLHFGPKLKVRPFVSLFSTAFGYGTIALDGHNLKVTMIEGELPIEKPPIHRWRRDDPHYRMEDHRASKRAGDEERVAFRVNWGVVSGGPPGRGLDWVPVSQRFTLGYSRISLREMDMGRNRVWVIVGGNVGIDLFFLRGCFVARLCFRSYLKNLYVIRAAGVAGGDSLHSCHDVAMR